MTILILQFEDSIGQFLREILAMEGLGVTIVQTAKDTIQHIEETNGGCLLFADNFHLGFEASKAFALLRERPEMRQRVRIVGISVMDQRTAKPWITDGLIDEYIAMPFNFEEVLDKIERA